MDSEMAFKQVFAWSPKLCTITVFAEEEVASSLYIFLRPCCYFEADYWINRPLF